MLLMRYHFNKRVCCTTKPFSKHYCLFVWWHAGNGTNWILREIKHLSMFDFKKMCLLTCIVQSAQRLLLLTQPCPLACKVFPRFIQRCINIKQFIENNLEHWAYQVYAVNIILAQEIHIRLHRRKQLCNWHRFRQGIFMGTAWTQAQRSHNLISFLLLFFYCSMK